LKNYACLTEKSGVGFHPFFKIKINAVRLAEAILGGIFTTARSKSSYEKAGKDMRYQAKVISARLSAISHKFWKVFRRTFSTLEFNNFPKRSLLFNSKPMNF